MVTSSRTFSNAPILHLKKMEFGKWNRKQESLVDKEREIKTSQTFFLLFFFSILEKEEIKSELAN